MKQVKRPSLKEALQNGQLIVPCVWDCNTEYIAETSGFNAVLLAGSTFATLGAGVPDIGLLTADEIVHRAESICNHANVPVIIDCDDGCGETPLNTYLMVKRLVRAGVAAVIVEDTAGFKGLDRCEQYFQNRGKDVSEKYSTVSVETWLSKIEAALEACKGTDCLVIALTSAKIENGLEEAIARCKAAKVLGADGVSICGLMDADEARKVNKEVPGLKLWSGISVRNGKQNVEMDELAEAGFELVTGHIYECAALSIMMDIGHHVIEAQNTVYSDNFELPKKNGVSVPRVGPGKPWLDLEDEFKEAAKKVTSEV